jgi:hypothetical protein
VSDFEGGEFAISSPESLASNSLIHRAMIHVLGLAKERESGGEKE